jgi:hypothetical protein
MGIGQLMLPDQLNCRFKKTNLYLLPGSPKIIEFDGQINDSVQNPHDILKNGCFGK